MPNRGPFDVAAHNPYRWHTYPKGHGMRRLDAADVAWWTDAGATSTVAGGASEDRFLESGSVRRLIENAGDRLMESQVAIAISNLAAAGVGMDGIASGAPGFFSADALDERCAILLDGVNDSISIGYSLYTEGYFDLRAAVDQSIVVPSHPSFNLTGDLTLLVKVAMGDWTPGSTQTIFSRWLPVSNAEDPPAAWIGGKVILLRLNGAGRLVYSWSTDGSSEVHVQSTASVPPASNELWLAVTHDVNNGSDGNTVRFFISESLAEPTAMTPLGTAIVNAGTTSFYVSEETPIRIGSRDANQDRAYGRFKTAIMRGSTGGADIGLTNEVFRLDADAIYDETVTTVPVAVPAGVDATITGTILKRPGGGGACFGPQESSTIILCGQIGPIQLSGARLFDSQPASLLGGQAIHATGTSGAALTGRVGRAGVGTQAFVAETAITNAPDVVCLRIDRDASVMRLWTNSGGETTTTVSPLLGSSQRFTDIYIGSSNEGTQYADFDFYSGAILRKAVTDDELDLIGTMFLDASDRYDDGDYWTVTTPGVFDGVYFAPGDQVLAINPNATTVPAYLIPSISGAGAADAPDLEITDNVRFTAKVRKADLTTGAFGTIAGKIGGGPPDYSWRWSFFYLDNIVFGYSPNGTDFGDIQVLSAADIAANFDDDTDFYIGLDIDFDNDVLQSLGSDDGVNWYPIGAPVGAPLGYPHNATAALEIGRQHGGSTHIWDGRIYWVQANRSSGGSPYLVPTIGTVTTPDPGPLPNGCVIVVKARKPLITDPVPRVIVAQALATTNKSWAMYFHNGLAAMMISTDGSNENYPGLLNAETFFDDGEDFYLAAAIYGSGTTLYTQASTSPDGATWTPATVVSTLPGYWPLYDSSVPISLGGSSWGGLWDGRIYSAELRTGLDPALTADRYLAPTIGYVTTPDAPELTITGNVRITAKLRFGPEDGSFQYLMMKPDSFTVGLWATYVHPTYFSPGGANTVLYTHDNWPSLYPANTDTFFGIELRLNHEGALWHRALVSDDGVTWAIGGPNPGWVGADRYAPLTSFQDSASLLYIGPPPPDHVDRIYWMQVEKINQRHLVFPSVAGNHLTMPYAANLDIFGPMTIFLDIDPLVTTRPYQVVFSRLDTATPAWQIYMDGANLAFNEFFAGGGGITAYSGVLPGMPGGRVRVAVTRVFNGANAEVRWFISTDGTTWTQTGTTGIAPGAPRSSPSGVFIGDQAPSTFWPFHGRIRRVTLASGVGASNTPGGTPVLDVSEDDAAGWTTGSFPSRSPRYVQFPGAGANSLSTPHAAGQVPTGDAEFVARVSMADWTAPAGIVICKNGSYYLVIGVGINLWSTVGGTTTYPGSTAHGFVNGATGWIKATRVAATGVTSFYSAVDSPTEPTTWTARGSTTGPTGVLSVPNQPLELGTYIGVNGPMTGRIMRAIIRNGIGGPAVFDFNAQNDLVNVAPAATSFTVTTGQTVTVNRSGSPSTELASMRVTPVGNVIQEAPDEVMWRFDADEAPTDATTTTWTDPRGRQWTATNPHAISGRTMWKFDASEYPGSGTSYIDPRGREWTLTNAAAIKQPGELLWRFDADDYPGTGTSYIDPRGRPWSVTNATAIVPLVPGSDTPMQFDEVAWARVPLETIVAPTEIPVQVTHFGFIEMNGPPSITEFSFFDDPVIFPYRRLDIHNHDGSLWREDCPLISGSVTVDYSRDERRSGDCEIWLPDANIGPGGLWYDKVFRFYRGIILGQYHRDPSYTSATLVWQLGSFMADRIAEGSESANFRITFRDLSKRMMLSKLTEAITFPEGTEIAIVIRALAANSGILDMLIPATGKQIGKDFTFETGTSRWEVAKKIANDFGHELFFDHRGWLIMRPFIDPLTAPIYLNLVAKRTGLGADNRRSNVGSYDRSASDERIYNHIVVIAEGTDRTTVYRAEARNTLSNSPTSIERIGERTLTYTSNFITTQAQAQETANSLLAINALEQFTINVGSAVYPWVEVGTTINFEDDNPNDNFPSRYLLLNATIPLGLENMSLAGSRITIVGSPPS